MTSNPDADGMLGHYLYRSTARDNVDHDDLDDILKVARSRNEAEGLTGCLHFEDGLFFQWLEGPQQALEHVVALIESDSRHSDIAVLSSGPLGNRLFADWKMRLADRDRESLVDWFASRSFSTVDKGAYARGVRDFLLKISA